MHKSSFIFAVIPFLFAAGCAVYHPAPLSRDSVEKALMIPAPGIIERQALALQHPILKPIELDPSQPLTPEGAAVLAVLINPSLRAVRDRIGVSSAQLISAGILPNPQLTASADVVTAGPGVTSPFGIGINWDITSLITHDVKVRAARVSLESVRLDVAWSEWQVAQTAEAAVFDQLALDAQLRLAKAVNERLAENLRLIQGAYDWLTVVCAIIATAVGGYWYGHHSASKGRAASRWVAWLAGIGVVLLVLCGGYGWGRADSGKGAGWIGWVLGVLLLVELALAGYWFGRRSAHRVMPRWVSYVAAIATGLMILTAALYIGFSFGDRGATTTDAQQGAAAAGSQTAGQDVVVPVQTVALRMAEIKETITAYGRTVAQPGATRIVSLPYEAIVQRLIVTVGEQVQAGDPLVEMAPAASTRLQLQQAREAASTAQMELQQVQEQYNQRLATKTQLLQAQHAFKSADSRLKQLEDEGAGSPAALKAPIAGIVSDVAVQEGQLVPPGTPLVALAMADRIEVKLGVEPEDVSRIHVGDAVQLTPVHLDPGQSITGNIRLISRQVSPKTELIDVFVSLPTGAPLTLRQYVRGTLVTASKKTLVVPSQAVLPEKNSYVLFTVHDGQAVKHDVHLGLETQSDVEVVGDGLSVGDRAVVSGNYELKPGMAVSLEKSQ